MTRLPEAWTFHFLLQVLLRYGQETNQVMDLDKISIIPHNKSWNTRMGLSVLWPLTLPTAVAEGTNTPQEAAFVDFSRSVNMLRFTLATLLDEKRSRRDIHENILQIKCVDNLNEQIKAYNSQCLRALNVGVGDHRSNNVHWVIISEARGWRRIHLAVCLFSALQIKIFTMPSFETQSTRLQLKTH